MFGVSTRRRPVGADEVGPQAVEDDQDDVLRLARRSASPVRSPRRRAAAPRRRPRPAAWISRRRLSRGPPAPRLLVIQAVLDLDQRSARAARVRRRARRRSARRPRRGPRTARPRPRATTGRSRSASPVRGPLDRDPLVADRRGVDALLVADAGERQAALVLGRERRRRAGAGAVSPGAVIGDVGVARRAAAGSTGGPSSSPQPAAATSAQSAARRVARVVIDGAE